jgi:GNAT superfamily N-acetyltransferase
VIPSFRQEIFSIIADELQPLMEANHLEVRSYSDIPLHIDYPRYLAAEIHGLLRLYTVRTEADELIGYAAFLCAPGLNCCESLQAQHTGLYIAPEHRNGRTARLFIDWCDQRLKAQGVQVVSQSVPDRHNYGPLLVTLGYELKSHNYARRLDG